MILRQIEPTLRRSALGYPALLLAGPRQSGKTTLARRLFADRPYVNLEDPIERAEFRHDPVRFLDRFPEGAVLDEVQHTPEILSHLQVRIDARQRLGAWILTGSQQIELVASSAQSLAGRVAIHELLPLSYEELRAEGLEPRTLEAAVLTGGYPPLHDRTRLLDPVEWMSNYLSTYVHRDVTSVHAPRDRAAFDRFLRLCAARSGHLLVVSELARDCSVDQKTIGAWITALEACFVVRTIRPYFRNFGKRLVKAPRLYFLDTGLACRLLDITNVQQLAVHPLRGALFETWCFAELTKFFANRGLKQSIWSWRTSDDIEIDFLIQHGHELVPMEVKANATPRSSQRSNIDRLIALGAREPDVALHRGLVLYGGEELRSGGQVDHVPWTGIAQAMERFL